MKTVNFFTILIALLANMIVTATAVSSAQTLAANMASASRLNSEGVIRAEECLTGNENISTPKIADILRDSEMVRPMGPSETWQDLQRIDELTARSGELT